MKFFGKAALSGSTSLYSAALVAMVGFAAPAYAQDAPPPQDAAVEGDCVDANNNGVCDDQEGRAIVVTGSRIRQPTLESNVPVTTILADELLGQGDVNVGDALNDLPAIRSTFSQANSARFIGTTGLNFLDLRGLGTQRTLVLVNGRRHVTSNVGEFDVDINTIPSDLIERVDVITGGNSAVYGSDAVAGVVNFVLKRNFEGLELRGQSGISGKGDRGVYSVSGTAGTNFAEDRGNVALNLEYVNSEELFLRDRPGRTGAFAGRNQFNAAEFVAGEPGSGDGVPDNQFFSGVRNAGISDGGTVTAPIAAATCRNPAITAAQAALCINPGTQFGQPRFFNFAPDGSLVQQIPSLDFRPFGSGNIITAPGQIAPGSTLLNTGVISPSLDRYTANVLANFEFSPAFRLFAEAKYVHIKSIEEGQPSFFQSSFPAFFGAGRGIRCDNPFLTAENIATLQTIGRCAGGAASTETIPLGRFSVDFGGRSDRAERDTYRIVAGVGGDFNDDWNYEVSFNYGRTDIDVDARNDLHIFDIDDNGEISDEGPFLRAIDSVRNASGQIVCRVNADAITTNDDPACLPINPFGSGRNSAAAIDYVNTTSFLTSKAEQYNALAYVGGDLSQLFELPGGPVAFVVGGEFRREEAFQEADPLSAAGATFFNAFPVFDPPAFEVYEAFGEIRVPLLRDLPFAEELSVSAAARYSDYNTAANKTFTYNVSGTYAPIPDIRFRANYSKSVRVPTLGDLFTPPTQNFAFVADPCDFRRIGQGGANRLANCRALGVPDGFESVITNSQTAEIVSSGNPFLEEETGKSLTVGAVFQPRFVPGLTLTVDYYDIEVEDRIETLGAQTILNQCVDLPSIDNQFCQLIFPRATVDDPSTPFNEIGSLDSPALISGGINFARGTARGIDFDVAYRTRFGNDTRLDLRVIATRVLERNNFVSPIDPDFNNRQLSEFGDPKWAANFTATLGAGPVDLRYTVNYIGPMIVPNFAYENFFPLQGRPPTNADALAEPFLDSVTYHAARLSLKVNDEFTFYGGVDNIFDKEVEELGGNLGITGGDPYDPIGRFFYVGFKADLGSFGDLFRR